MSDFIELLDVESPELKMIQFGSNGKVLFELPALGQKGVPLAISTSFLMFKRLFDRKGMDNAEAVNAWVYFIESLAASYPVAARWLGANADSDQLTHVLKHWVGRSEEVAGFDPKV